MTQFKTNNENLGPSIKFIWGILGEKKSKFLKLLTIVQLDTALTVIGIGLILPVFQSIFAIENTEKSIISFISVYEEMEQETKVFTLSIVIIILFFLKSYFNLLNAGYTRFFAEAMRASWCRKIGANMLYGSYTEFIKRKHGKIQNDWFVEPLTASRFLTRYTDYLSQLSLTLILISLGFLVDWRVMLGFLSISFVFLLFFKKHIYNTTVEHSKYKSVYNQDLTVVMAETINHLKDIKILSAEKKQILSLDKVLTKIRLLFIKMALFRTFPRVIGELIAVLALVGLMCSSFLFENFNLVESLPTILFFFVTCYKIITAGTQAIASRVSAWQDFNSVKIVNKLCKEDYAQENPGNLNFNENHDIKKGIEIKNVSFSYDGKVKILDRYCTKIPVGKVTFIAGGSGSGKSTLLDLIMRIVKADSGIISLDGKNIEEYDLTSWRRICGYVSQDSALFHGSIRENITFGTEGLKTEEILEACEVAGCYDFIDKLPNKVDTIVGEKGYVLSGGQRKRIAIARIVARKPAIMIFDEVASSFEKGIEKDIIINLKSKFPKLTIIQTSHMQRNQDFIDFRIDLNSYNQKR